MSMRREELGSGQWWWGQSSAPPPPVPVPFTIGYSGIAPNSATTNFSFNSEANTTEAERHVAAAACSITRVWVFGSREVPGDADTSVRIAVYQYEGGVPTVRVAVVDVPIGADVAWHSLDVSVPLVEGTEYCIAIDYWNGDTFGFNGHPWIIRYEDAVGSMSRNCSAQGGCDDAQRLPDPWAENGVSSARVSFYAEGLELPG